MNRLRAAVRAFKAAYIRDMLAAYQGNRTQTAKALGVERTYLVRLIRELGLTAREIERLRQEMLSLTPTRRTP